MAQNCRRRFNEAVDVFRYSSDKRIDDEFISKAVLYHLSDLGGRNMVRLHLLSRDSADLPSADVARFECQEEEGVELLFFIWWSCHPQSGIF
jgi:hypothetical protein